MAKLWKVEPGDLRQNFRQQVRHTAGRCRRLATDHAKNRNVKRPEGLQRGAVAEQGKRPCPHMDHGVSNRALPVDRHTAPGASGHAVVNEMAGGFSAFMSVNRGSSVGDGIANALSGFMARCFFFEQ